MKIPFNKPFLTGNEIAYIQDAVESGKISGNGKYTQKCHSFFERNFGFKKCLLTTSCTDALEMCALLADISPGDEVILPSYTFVSTANAFLLRGAKLIFADSRQDHPGIDEMSIKPLITDRTKAIVVVHYAGVACDMDIVMEMADEHNIFVIEDAAQAIDSYYKGRPLGSIGHLAAFSFHETKNVIAGEGGLLVVNDHKLQARAEVIWEKGTNRSAFFRGEIDKYGWVDIGSSYLPSEVVSAFLYAQLESISKIQARRKAIWDRYNKKINERPHLWRKPFIPEFATNNAHMYYLVCENYEIRAYLIEELKKCGVLSVFHYLSLHKSKMSQKMGFDSYHLSNSDMYSDRLLRLPMYNDLSLDDVDFISSVLNQQIQ